MFKHLEQGQMQDTGRPNVYQCFNRQCNYNILHQYRPAFIPSVPAGHDDGVNTRL